MSVRASAVVCTYNRAPYLRRAIRSLVDQSLPTSQYEIVVVDNGSSDGTPQMIEEEFSRVPNLTRVVEPARGLAHARNAGFRQATGAYVAYLDDDAVAGPSWLAKIVEVFETVHPTPGCVGGKVDPLWEAARPRWLADGMLAYLSVVDWSATPVTLDDGRFLVGTNMAFPRRLLEELGGFRAGLGREGARLTSNEEILLENELRRRGYSCYYHPAAAVGHHVPATRLVQRYFVRRYYWQGVSDAVLALCERRQSRRDRIGSACRHARAHLRDVRSWVNLLRPTQDPGRFHRKCEMLRDVGYVKELLSVWR